MTISPSKPSWDDVLAALRSGKYTPNEGGAMCTVPGSGYIAMDGTGDVYDIAVQECYWCPLGVIRNLAGTKWSVLGENLEACDDDGETQVPDYGLLDSLGLRGLVSITDELSPLYKDAFGWWYGDKGVPERWEVVSFLHDVIGYEFTEIADEIERLGWNRG